MKPIGLYIHIPFCIKKCHYCDFVSFAYDPSKVEAYVEHLIKEINLHKNTSYEIKSIFFGGGTPSLLSGQALSKIMAAIKNQWTLSDDVEITLESNPGTWTYEKAKAYKSLGINRISMGVQSLSDNLLKVLGRQHTTSQVYESMAILKKAGFENINLDLMFALPGQTIEDLKESLDKIIDLGPSHISAYSLTYEEGTPLYKYVDDKVNDDIDREMYHQIIKTLKNRGYIQYEISNFSKEGYACVHNMIYWKNIDYIGIGLNAHSYIEGNRQSNVREMDAYIDMIDKKQLPVLEINPLTQEDLIFEYIMLGLRLLEGISISDFNQRFNEDFQMTYQDILQDLLEAELCTFEKGRLKLTLKGLDLSNQVFLKFM